MVHHAVKLAVNIYVLGVGRGRIYAHENVNHIQSTTA